MSRTYKVTGINLKSMPMGESDRLLTILTPELGLVRAIAMGARKHNSSLGGRSGLFVVNELLLAQGRSLDKVAQAETIESYPGLSQDLKKLTASQYLAELCLYQALSDQPQEELFCLLNTQLKRLEQSPPGLILPHLTHALFQLLILAGVVPQVRFCCITRQPLVPDLVDSTWRVGFSPSAGGAVTLAALEKLKADHAPQRPTSHATRVEAEARARSKQAAPHTSNSRNSRSRPYTQLTAIELNLLQQLDNRELLMYPVELGVHKDVPSEEAWRSVEHLLRHYAEYHFDRQIRSATLIDACFAPTAPSLTS